MNRHTVAEVMTTDVVTARTTCGYKEIVLRLASHRTGALPVVDDENHIVGIVSEADLLPKLAITPTEHPPDLLTRGRDRIAQHKAAATTAGGLMTSPAVTVSAATSLAYAARLMAGRGVSHLPVVDTQGRVVGIVHQADLLRLFLRSDDDIAVEIRDEVILRTLWMNPDTVTVTVSDGVVTLHGTVDRRGTVPVLLELVRAVAGVVDVVNTLHARDGAHHAVAPVD